MENQIEIWKIIDGFKDYEISSFGKIKSLKNGGVRILKPSINSNGYYIISLCIDGISYKKKIHQLVAKVFLGHNACGMELVINHIDFNKLNNNVSNLEIISQRENTSKRKNLENKTSKYIGVCFKKNRYEVSIQINGKVHYLGRFKTEEEANEKYLSKLNSIIICKN